MSFRLQQERERESVIYNMITKQINQTNCFLSMFPKKSLSHNDAAEQLVRGIIETCDSSFVKELLQGLLFEITLIKKHKIILEKKK